MTKCHTTNKILTLTDNINKIMTKIKNVWSQLKPVYKQKIRQNTYKHGTAKRLKYTLMASHGWWQLQLDDIRDILVFTDKYSFDVTGADIMYGTEFLKEESDD
ncbi:hypothetical protein DRO61_03350 [Candidatus Bathyarchaeota archaeon]|nr:MAG: hypothetical protein DRO61_03350 [Candidatus Bathyarchaeota archaeon]RLI65748.1 MAG: hypothetical protein DRO67_02285 [Candidatus Asgardarchaeum californiense]